MVKKEHIPELNPCPHLPLIESPLGASAMKACGRDRGAEFYILALKCAQSLWLQGLPAQSMLLMNRAFGADHASDPLMCQEAPLPYAAMAWVMQNRRAEQFIGNPRRHFQHLATRMVPPRKEIRRSRAWACWLISCHVFPDYPSDIEQIENEGIVEPTAIEIENQLNQLGLPGESELWKEAVDRL